MQLASIATINIYPHALSNFSYQRFFMHLSPILFSDLVHVLLVCRYVAPLWVRYWVCGFLLIESVQMPPVAI